jgi:hypothetical protein
VGELAEGPPDAPRAVAPALEGVALVALAHVLEQALKIVDPVAVLEEEVPPRDPLPHVPVLVELRSIVVTGDRLPAQLDFARGPHATQIHLGPCRHGGREEQDTEKIRSETEPCTWTWQLRQLPPTTKVESGLRGSEGWRLATWHC